MVCVELQYRFPDFTGITERSSSFHSFLLAHFSLASYLVCVFLFLQMKSTEVDQGLFTDSYCKVCSAQLISESQRVAHYEVKSPPKRYITQALMHYTAPVELLSHLTPLFLQSLWADLST